MSWGCEHDWVEKARTYAPPVGFEEVEKGSTHIHFVGLLQGLTTILWECSKCHNIRKEEMLGKVI